MKVIELGLGLSLSLPTVRKVMKKMGFTPQRPLHRAYEQDAALVEQWLKVELPALRQRAEAEGARLMFGDEASIRTDYHAIMRGQLGHHEVKHRLLIPQESVNLLI